jgi:hypothetical protein
MSQLQARVRNDHVCMCMRARVLVGVRACCLQATGSDQVSTVDVTYVQKLIRRFAKGVQAFPWRKWNQTHRQCQRGA